MLQQNNSQPKREIVEFFNTDTNTLVKRFKILLFDIFGFDQKIKAGLIKNIDLTKRLHNIYNFRNK